MPGRKQKQTRRRKFSLVLDKACDERTRPQYYDTLKDRFVRHALPPERTKALVFVFVFVFVLAHEQANRKFSQKIIELVARPVALQRTTLKSPHHRRRPSRSQRGCRSPLLAWRTWPDTSVARKSSSLGARASFSSSTTKRPSARPGSTARPTWQVW